MSLHTITSALTVKGYHHGNTYYITKPDEKVNRFHVYQVMVALNRDMSVEMIRSVSPDLQQVPDHEVIVAIPNESHPAFLFMHDVSMAEMNRFRMTLSREEMIDL